MGLMINQQRYALDLLILGRQVVYPATTPIDINNNVSIKDGQKLEGEDIGKYHVVGKLIYQTLTRSDITYAVNISKFIHTSTNIHIQIT